MTSLDAMSFCSAESIDPPNGSAGNPNASHSVGLFDPNFSQARRRQLDAINKLQSLGAQLDIDIPQIVVIGSQSAGKSSLIESISGITLPRSLGTCTRCPTECLLVHSTDPWECRVSVRFMTDESGLPLQKVRNDPFGQPIRNPAEVEDRIRRAQRAALNPSISSQLFLKGGEVPEADALAFTTNCISLDIRGPDVTDLSFCDLPGLIANADHDDDVEKVTQLVSSYISKPSCIILLTVACESDFETQGAYRLAKKYDTDGTRTIGVLTKPDRIPEGEQSRWIRLIRNERSPLSNGWYCVKQPSTSELEEQLTFQDYRRRGEVFFRSMPWSTLESKFQNQLGTRALTSKLNEFLMELISKRIPELVRELENALRRTRDELKQIPAPVSKDPLMDLLHIIGDLSDDMFRHAEGLTYNISDPSKAGTEDNQFEGIRLAHEIFRRTMRATAPNFHPFDRPQPSPQLQAPCIYEAPMGYEEVADYSRDPVFLKSEEEEYALCSNNPIYLDDVVQRVLKATTRELPGYYPFKVLQDLVSCSTDQWEHPAHSLVDTIYSTVLNHHSVLVEKHFRKYTAGRLLQKVLKIVQEYTQERRDDAVKRVNWALELEAHAFTLNKHYLGDYRTKFLAFYNQRRQDHFGRHYRIPALDPWDPNQYGLEIMATVRAYFQVAYKRVVDILPLAIDRELVRIQKRDVQEAISFGLGITGPDAHERCERLLAEPPEILKRREELKNKLARLTEALNELGYL